jgi:alanine racemase
LRPTYAEIDLSAIAFNVQQIKKRVAPAQVMAVVKADGYGHGALETAKVALANGATYLGVALVEEGIALRQNGIQAPILVFGGAFEDQLNFYFSYNLEITVYQKDIINKLSLLSQRHKKPIVAHVKVDTGMGRVGISHEEAVSFVELVRQTDGIFLQGLYTHFATADEENKQYAHLQFDRFKSVILQLENKGIHLPLKHAANSGAIIDLPETYLDMVRPGVMMYGYYPSNDTTESVPIEPAMTFKTKVLFIKEIPPQTSVSYGRKFISDRVTRIATLPVGYADGYNRLLMNKGEVTIRGKKFPVIGRVCMDLIHVNLGEDKTIQIGDEVILFGREKDNAFTVTEICRLISTIPYEVTCWISRRVPRAYVNN